MRHLIKILVITLILISVRIYGNLGLHDVVSSAEITECVRESSGEIIGHRNADNDYTCWNCPELLSAQGYFNEGRENIPITKLRTSVRSTSHSSSSFYHTGKLVDVRFGIEFFSRAGLFPSGRYTFSHHLISLRKMRL